jgi:hypothetical protein
MPLTPLGTKPRRDAARAALRKILGCMAGEDGGVSYVQLQSFVLAPGEGADAGDPAANEMILMVERFARLIDVATRAR